MTTINLEDIDFNNLTLADHERIGEILSEWAESDEFFEALDKAEFLPRTPEGVERVEKIVKAATRGRPALAAEVNGHYTKEQGLKTSDVVRKALDSYLPQLS